MSALLSDVEIVLGAYPRVRSACRGARPDSGGRPGPSEAQLRILRQLDAEDPVMVTELAEFLGVTPSTMSLNLTRLERAGWIVRRRDPEDRRVMNVRLTPVGARVLEQRPPLDPARVDAMLAMMRPEDRRRAVEGLALLAEAADALVARGSAYLDALTGAGD